MADRDEFKFPDEVEQETPAEKAEKEPEFEIQVEDDTPPEDRGRKPLQIGRAHV